MKFNLKKSIFGYRLGMHLIDSIDILPNFEFKLPNNGPLIIKKEDKMLYYPSKTGRIKVFGYQPEIEDGLKANTGAYTSGAVEEIPKKGVQ